MAERRGWHRGTPIEVAESALLSRKQPVTSRAPRVWEQIVTDERGRRRLHGAFTGGFSAGYFNSVDTKEGFVPKTFRTSRSRRAEETTQSVQDFYDKDELEELANVNITTKDTYDTFATSRNEKARERTEREAQARPIIPGDVIGEFVEGVSESIGVRMLQKMGWRQGKGLGEVFQSQSGRKWGPEASLSQQRSHVWSEKPKMNTQGLGFDPFLGSKSFKRHKAEDDASNCRGERRSRGIAFGVGVLEETDTFGEIGDYVEALQDGVNYYDLSDHSEEGRAPRRSQTGPKKLGYKSRTEKDSFLPEFHLGPVLNEAKIYPLPVVPAHFTGRHVATETGVLGPSNLTHLSIPAPNIPADEKLKRSIDSVAVFVAKGGVMSEELVRQEHQGDESFGFLFGREGSEYYRWKLLNIKVTFQKLGVQCTGVREAPLTADDRGFLLGDERMKEEPTASKAVSHPFIQGVPEEDRQRVRSALNASFVKSSADSTLHIEETVPGLRPPKPRDQLAQEEEKDVQSERHPAELKPVRSFVDWHPVPLLYKRFNVLDPLKGMPIEAEPKSKFMSYESGLDEVKAQEPGAEERPPPTTSIADEVDVSQPPPEYTEPPLDIFKSIFDSPEEEETSAPSSQGVPEENDLEALALEEEKAAGAPPASESAPQPIRPSDEQRPQERKRLNLSSDESETEAKSKSEKKKRRKKKEKAERQDIEEVIKGLSTSEFKTMLKTLKKGREKKAKRKKRKNKEQKLTAD